MEIDDKTFTQIITELDGYMFDDCLIECIERVIVALNRYRDVEKIPILMGGEIYDKETRKLIPHPEIDIQIVKNEIKRLNIEYKNDKWIN